MRKSPKEFAEILTEGVIAGRFVLDDILTIQEEYEGKINRVATYRVVSVHNGMSEIELENLQNKIVPSVIRIADYEGYPEEASDMFIFEMEEKVNVYDCLLLRIENSLIPYEVVDCVLIPKDKYDVIQEERYLVTGHTWRPFDITWDEYVKKMEV